MFAHNSQFDFKMLNGFKQLISRNWNLKSHYVKSKTFILIFTKTFIDGKKITLHIWDTMNYVPEKLENIGISVGFPKLHVEFDKVSDKELEIYCKRDTEIIYQFIKKLIEFLELNDLSRLKATSGSLSFNTFRHKFYNPTKENKEQIYIHDWKQAIRLERESYKGGITDCFKIGTYENLEKLDINSEYPSIMEKKKLPVKLLFYSHETKYNQETLFRIYNESKRLGFGIIMNCTIELPKNNAYILNNFNTGKSLFAYGIFNCSLCQPELEFVERYGKILSIHEISVYQMRNIFKDFVGFFYGLKNHYKKINDKINEKFCKLMLNTQYGKWGQRHIDTINLTLDNKFLIEFQEVIKLMIIKLKKKNPNFNLSQDIAYLGSIVNEGEIYILNGKLQLLKQTTRNSKDSFVAISSFITSHARMLLIKYIKIAKRENVYYVDTDSIFVNRKGYKNLKREYCINEFKLGKLKSEGFGVGTFYNPKFYDFNEVRKCKGVKKDSVILFENKEKVKYETYLWNKFKSDMKEGFKPEQQIITSTKTISKFYDKGNVDDFGNVIPYSVMEIYQK